MSSHSSKQPCMSFLPLSDSCLIHPFSSYEERELSSTSTPSSLSIPLIALPTPTSTFRARNLQSLSKRQLAHISPRLGVLNNIPFAIPFDTRVSVFRTFVLNDAIATAERRNTNS
ncbi:hypothetical protein H0H93_001991, partial [Arthromyces matolae]